jgi:NADP-dependent 3-hydroxy acid dehydrogenase YdfG
MSASNEAQMIIITGASSGIGLATVKAALQQGYWVLGISRHFDDPVVEHERLRIESLDLSDIEQLPARLTELADSIDLPIAAVVNNAGVGKIAFLEQLSFDDLQVCMNTNFMSHAMLSKALLPKMKKQGSGVFVFMGSEAALNGARQGSIYCASKFALRGFAQSLRDECNRAGVRVTLINPGATDTAFFDDLHYRPGAAPENVISPEQIATTILQVVSAPATTVIDEITLSPLSRVWERQ